MLTHIAYHSFHSMAHNIATMLWRYHPNPGISSIASSLNSSTSHNHFKSSLRSLNLSHNLSFVRYNVQSIPNKLDILEAELFEFDIRAFTETWLNPTVQSDD